MNEAPQLASDWSQSEMEENQLLEIKTIAGHRTDLNIGKGYT